MDRVRTGRRQLRSNGNAVLNLEPLADALRRGSSDGIRPVDPALVASARVLGAKPIDVVRHVLVPSALTWIFASLRSAVGFALTAQGDYHELMERLRKLETGEHYCRVISCDFKPLAETRGGTLSLTLDVELMGVQ